MHTYIHTEIVSLNYNSRGGKYKEFTPRNEIRLGWSAGWDTSSSLLRIAGSAIWYARRRLIMSDNTSSLALLADRKFRFRFRFRLGSMFGWRFKCWVRLGCRTVVDSPNALSEIMSSCNFAVFTLAAGLGLECSTLLPPLEVRLRLLMLATWDWMWKRLSLKYLTISAYGWMKSKPQDCFFPPFSFSRVLLLLLLLFPVTLLLTLLLLVVVLVARFFWHSSKYNPTDCRGMWLVEVNPPQESQAANAQRMNNS